LWRHISGGCHLDRKVDDLIRAAGFEILELRNEYARGPRLMTYMYEGQARPSVQQTRIERPGLSTSKTDERDNAFSGPAKHHLPQ